MDTFILIFATALLGAALGGAAILVGAIVIYPRWQARQALYEGAEEPLYHTQELPVPDTTHPYLEGIGGLVAYKQFSLPAQETVIGRSRVCDVQLEDPKVSRQHAMLRLYKSHYFLQDMQSSRGTQVNNQLIDTHHLQDGDEIRMGDSVFVFHLPT